MLYQSDISECCITRILTLSLLFICLVSCNSNGENEKVDSLANAPGSSSSNDSAPPGIISGEEWVRVPADTGSMNLPEFWVMKFEAKAWNDANSNGTIDDGEVVPLGCEEGNYCAFGGPDITTHRPISIADNSSWRSIDANSAAAECESLNTESTDSDRINDTNNDGTFSLISNPEWMAIARDAELEEKNWTEGSVGGGCLFRGNAGSNCGGYLKGNLNPDSGTERNPRAKLILNSDNTQEIFDLAGNVEEWVDWDKSVIGFQTGPTTCITDVFSGAELPAVNCLDFDDDDYNTHNGSYTTAQGVGAFFGGSGGAAVRGGILLGNDRYGLFFLMLSNSPETTSWARGFRCVYRP